MWNYVIAGLLVGSTVVLYDGNPAHPGLDAQWRIVERHKVTFFGTSPALVTTSLKAGLRPRDWFDLTSLKAIGATGSQLPADGFSRIADAVGEHLPISSISGAFEVGREIRVHHELFTPVLNLILTVSRASSHSLRPSPFDSARYRWTAPYTASLATTSRWRGCAGRWSRRCRCGPTRSRGVAPLPCRAGRRWGLRGRVLVP